MGTASYVRGNFLGGEWSKFAQGRYDLQNYPTALNVSLNGFPVEIGTWVRRPGTRFLGQTFGGRKARLIPFAFKNALPYTLEFTDTTLRMWAGTSSTAGISLATTNDAQIVSSISTASPADVTTAGTHGWSSGDHVYFSQQENREFVITVTGASDFTLQDQVTGQDIDGSTIGGLLAGTRVNRVLKLGSPYTLAQLSSIRKVQAETTAVFLNPGVAPYGIGVLTAPTSASFATFTSLAPAAFQDGPYLDQYVGTTVTPTGTSGSITLQTGGAAFPGFQPADVGRLVRLFSQPAQWNGGTAYVAGNVVALYPDPINTPAVATYYVCKAPSTGHSPDLTPSEWTLVTGTQYAVWTWGTITAVNSTSNVTVTIDGSALLYNSTVIYAWRLGAYGGANGYPTCGVYYEGRLWLGGAIANRFDASVANGISVSTSGIVDINFAPTDASGAVGAANAIAGTVNAEDANPILWMQSHQQGVIAGTQPAEWLIFAPSQGAIAPNNIAAHRVTKVGGASAEAIATEHTIVFIQRFTRKLIEYFADVFSGKYAAPNITDRSKHLTKGGLAEVVYQQELAPIIWARTALNALVQWVYKRDSLVSAQGPTFAAGARVTLGSGRQIESISVGPSTGGTTDTVMMATNNTADNVRWVEALSDILDEGSTLLDAQYLDAAIAPSWLFAAPTTNMPYGGLTLSGLWAHNGKTVTAWIGGLDCGDYTPSNGQITVPFGDGISAGTGGGKLTQAYVQSIPAIPMWVGYTYTSDGQIVRPNAPAETGARNGPGFMKLRQAAWAGFQVEGAVTRTISVGTTFDALDPLIFTQYEDGPELDVLTQFSGIKRVSIEDGQTFDSMLCWRVTRPYPANIVAVGAALDTVDI
jgi:hypothetical protein